MADWVDKQAGFDICNHVTPEIIGKYQEVLQYVQNCGLYKEQALPSGGLNPKTPNKNAKIPDVAKAFGVRTNNLYYMMRQLGIKI